MGIDGGLRIAWDCWGLGIRASFLRPRLVVIQIDFLLFHAWITLFIPAEMKNLQGWMEERGRSGMVRDVSVGEIVMWTLWFVVVSFCLGVFFSAMVWTLYGW